MQDITSLNEKFGIPDVAVFDTGHGELTRLTIHTSTTDADLYLHGAHVTGFYPHGQKPLLFMSAKSMFQADKPIRGGIPICFPWFGPKAGDPKAAAHGFARLLEWDVESITQTPAGEVAVTLVLQANDVTRVQWPAEFIARYTVTVGSSLHVTLAVTNNGTEAVNYEEALHTYLLVDDVHEISIDGLAGTTYLDKMNSAARTPQGPEPIKFTGETDRVYLATQSTCMIHDPGLSRAILVEKTGSDATVVWNPWINKAKAMADFGDDEWIGMVCVETCNVADCAVTLAPGATHTISATILSK